MRSDWLVDSPSAQEPQDGSVSVAGFLKLKQCVKVFGTLWIYILVNLAHAWIPNLLCTKSLAHDIQRTKCHHIQLLCCNFPT